MASTLLLILGCVVAVYVFLLALLNLTQSSEEPPVIETSIPFITPLRGLLPGMQKYFVDLRLVTETTSNVPELTAY
jgi:hypothetical protein